MIQISAQLGNGVTELTVTGHEDHAADGRVCAAVSAITHTALLGLEAIAQRHPDLVSITIQEN